jgi:radical SAM peptide maturase (CXXX-repeat target family)
MKKDKFHSRRIEKDKRIKTPKREISFFITEDCNLNCSYCYLPGKNDKHSMSFEVAKKGLDYFLLNPELFPERLAILDFIGGEPLLKIDVIDQIVDYFKVVTYRKKHRWFNNYKIIMTSNGTLCKSQKFQRFLKKNIKNAHIAISLDGIKEKHDLSRKYKSSGKGSYDDVIENLLFLKEITPNINIKATFSSNDLKYLKDSMIHLYNIGTNTKLFANVVYENIWKEG